MSLNHKADWLRPSELEALAAMCRALGQIDETHICFGPIEITDQNGEPLGTIESNVNENTPVFVPTGWRTD